MDTVEDFVPYRTLKSFGEMPEFSQVFGWFVASRTFSKSFGKTLCRDLQSFVNTEESLLHIAEGLRRDLLQRHIEFCEYSRGSVADRTEELLRDLQILVNTIEDYLAP